MRFFSSPSLHRWDSKAFYNASHSTKNRIPAATIVQQNANTLAALQTSLTQMQIKGAKEFEIIEKSPKTLHTKDDTPLGTQDGAPVK